MSTRYLLDTNILIAALKGAPGVRQQLEHTPLNALLLSTVVQVAYGTDVDGLRARIIERVRQVPRVLQEPGPAAHLTAFAADGLELTVFFWIADPENGQAGVRSGVNLAILSLFNELGVEIPYPQRVVHVRAPAQDVKPPAAAEPSPGRGQCLD